jgi:NTE family protein
MDWTAQRPAAQPEDDGGSNVAPIRIGAADRARMTRRRRPGRARRPRTAFVLSGGASLSALQVGMLRALYELGIAPDLIVATSAGAINGSFIASRPQTVATARELARIWRGLGRDDIFPVRPWVVARGLIGKRDHMISAGSLRTLLGRHLQYEDLADAPIPLHVVTFDLDAGTEVLLSAGPALDIVAASAAVPGVFPPVRVGDRRLIDGGVVNNTPISQAVALGAERVYVLPTSDPTFVPGFKSRSALGSAIGGLALLMRARLEADIALFSREVELIVFPAPNPLDVMPFDFGQANRLLRDGLVSARRKLAEPVAAAVAEASIPISRI